MELNILHRGGVKFEAIARGHSLVCDQPPVNGGADTGMTPPELLLASLGTCAGFYAVQYLKTRSLSVDGLRIKIFADKLAQPARLGRFRIEVTVPDVDPRHQDGILRAVNSCLIHNTLLHAPSIEVTLNAPVAAPAG